MKTNTPIISLVSCLLIVGCTFPPFTRPLRLYDLGSGNTIEVVLYQTSRDHGIISSPAHSKDRFQGEYVLLDRSAGSYPLP